MSVVRLSFERFKSIGAISFWPLIIIGTEQIIFLFICSSSVISFKPKFELKQEITHEYVWSLFEPLIQSLRNEIYHFINQKIFTLNKW